MKEILSRFGLWFGDSVINVESSMMQSVRYDRHRRALTITFKSGKSYEYGSLSPNVYRGLVQAKSKGSFFSRQIRPVYPYRQIPS